MNPIAIFTGPYALLAKWAVIGIVLLSAFGTGWVKGNQHGTQKLTDYQAKQATESVKVIVKQGATTERVVIQYVKVAGQTKVVTNTIEKEVERYVEGKPLALSCMLDNRWVRLHDSAATGAVPPAAAGDDGTSGEISAAQALTVITQNYGAAHRNEDKLTFCQNWVREQFKTVNGTALGY